ncbi:reductase [Streptomyces sp. MMG1533]|uniref:2Fe-2S iron-sulfur cluster-binding protein n=1 Tax=Streptomyces sp. MMG1533 TaxID=1415546 RepID=UPI0006AF4739|nr:2Fe-2S iron-sulfur cluster-binding protein [Streptomyces sp. MMG1533]KOU59822.1 reductase [Streptomyces sp. MMG1533]
MPKVTYTLPDGTERTVEASDGESVMESSVRNNLPGILAECGGNCSCATCHVYVDPAWRHLFDEPTDEEAELLEFAEGAREESRLACQLVVRDACDGVRVTVVSG